MWNKNSHMKNSISSIVQPFQEKLEICLFCTAGIELKYLLAINSALPRCFKIQQLVYNFYSFPYCYNMNPQKYGKNV